MHSAQVCNETGRCPGGHRDGQGRDPRHERAVGSFLGADYRPVALTAGSRALVRVVDDLGFLSDRITDHTGRLLGDMKPPLVRVLRDSAAVLACADPAARAARGSGSRLRAGSICGPSHRAATARTSSSCSVSPMTPPPSRSAANCWAAARFRPPSASPAASSATPPPPTPGPVWARVLGRRLPADRHRGLGDAGNHRGRGDHQGIHGHQGGGAAATVCAPAWDWHWRSR